MTGKRRRGDRRTPLGWSARQGTPSEAGEFARVSKEAFRTGGYAWRQPGGRWHVGHFQHVRPPESGGTR